MYAPQASVADATLPAGPPEANSHLFYSNLPDPFEITCQIITHLLLLQHYMYADMRQMPWTKRCFWRFPAAHSQ